jgi:hypothetical protein
LRTAHVNYAAKRNISAVSGLGEDEDQTDTPSNNSQGNGGNSKRQATADTSNAGDHMRRGRQTYISQIRSSRRYVHDRCIISASRQTTDPLGHYAKN